MVTHQYSGTALLGPELEPTKATIYCADGIITAIEEEKNSSPYWICPGFCNAHTHLADTLAMDVPRTGSLESLVTPPNGLKHRILNTSSESALINGMLFSLQTLSAAGTSSCIDFREGGAKGALHLIQAAELHKKYHPHSCTPIILGRNGGEQLKKTHGAGISSTRDEPNYQEIAAEMRKQGKIIAFHAGERDSHDIDPAISCDPDLIVHATHATQKQIQTLSDQQIPVCVCPRSNFILGVTNSAQHPPIQHMLDADIPLSLGTDNVMFVQPDLLLELKLLDTIYHIDPKDALIMAISGSSIHRRSPYINIGNPANLFLIDPTRSNLQFSRDPLATIVRRVTAFDIIDTYFPYD
ncbi:MAG: amidohydrolase family protein [Methanomicrobiales archaeon]|jgi:cytosine/adenosine deaminase-related metal-dependent hydrolase|nr:amidohydrolase family protein [Methanomicrobiales archaeon]